MGARAERVELFEPLPDDLVREPARAEEQVLERWRAGDALAQVLAARAGAPAFVFWEGPPTANGRPGIHHVLARTIKDVACRWHSMLGKRVVRKAGWDTHGLPVELEVEKALKISGKPAIESLPVDPATGLGGVARFNDECRRSVWTFKEEWERLSERIGFWLDYKNPYVTYDPAYVESLWAILKRFHDKGLIVRGRRVLPWCGRCGTGLSSHELAQPGAYRDVIDPSVIVRLRLRRSLLPVNEQQGLPEYLLVWTTTPWTLPSNFAAAVAPDAEYQAIEVPRTEFTGKQEREVVWVALNCAESTIASEAVNLAKSPAGSEAIRNAGGGSRFLAIRRGREMVGASYEPLFSVAETYMLEVPTDGAPEQLAFDEWHKVRAAGFVSLEEGTGIVHQAPYGADDYDLAKREQIEMVPLFVGPDGRFNKPVLESAGGLVVVPLDTSFKEADQLILESLQRRGLLYQSTRNRHSYPHCWRCDTPLFYFPAPAWFIRTTAYKERMVELNRRIRWVPPEIGEKRFGEWLENVVDWNISRERYWGTPLPFWICGPTGCGAVVAIGSIAELRERAGRLPEDFNLHQPSVDRVIFPCVRPDCTGEMRRTPQVADVWFDSGAMPYAQYHWPFEGSAEKLTDQFPADFIAEGLDQTRGWFYTLHAIGAFLTDPRHGFGLPDGPTYKTCVVNGLVLDKDGVKMSKRLGNVVDPWRTIAEHGADAVRWYSLSSGSPWLPKRFDPKGIADVRRRFFGTLANSYGFLALYGRLEDGFDPRDAAIPALPERPEIDRWLASRAESLLGEVRRRMEEYDVAGSCRALEQFVVDELSNWYIRRNRSRFWQGSRSADGLAAFATLHECLKMATLCLAPFAPFMAELLWSRLEPGEGSVHAALLPAVRAERVDPVLERSMSLVVRIVEMGRALRERAGLRTRQPLRAIHVRSPDAEGLALLRGTFATDQILGELNVKGWGSLAADDGTLCRLRAKPNFRVLGKKLGSRMKQAAAAIEALGPAEVARLREGGVLELAVAGETLVLEGEDVAITVEGTAGFDVEADGRWVVFLDTDLDAELIAEGLAREAISRVNGLRKERALAVEDRIRLRLDPRGVRSLEDALRAHAATIAAETLAIDLVIGSASPADSVDCDLGDGLALGVQLVRA